MIVSESRQSNELADDEKAKRLAAYDEVVRAAKLAGIKLYSSSFKINPEYYPARDEELESQKSLLNRGFTWTHEPVGFVKESGILAGVFNWGIEVKKGRKRLVSAKAGYMVIYTDVPPVDDEPALAFLKKVGRFACYPYFRSYVAQMGWAAEADLPILPVLKDR
jgi:hypothetical protein